MKSKIFLLSIIGLSILFASNLYAQVKPGSFSMIPNVGYYFFDSDQDIDRSLTYGIGLGYDFIEQLGVEGTINRIDTETEYTKADVKGYLGRLDALLYFSPEKKFVPYMALGVSDLYLDRPGDKSDFAPHYGLGAKYFFNDNIAFRVDGRHIMVSHENNYLVTAGLNFIFGGKKKAVAVEEKPVAQAAPPKDSDGDGVIDDNDQCPNTPTGTKVDSKGCPLDSDKDGVMDDNDQCPNTPAGTKVDGKGCPLDSDKDGVIDDNDQCPNTPAGTKVDSKGCPLDSDKDGVIDDNDQCPNTPAGTKVDTVGCPMDSDGDGVVDEDDQCPDTPKGVTVDSRGCWVLRDLRFDTNKADINTEGARILDNVVTIMQANPTLRLEIQGHTDNKGSAAYNKTLSQKRANAVMGYMVGKGIDKDRLSAVGYGLERPAASNDTEEGRAENRRVELNPIQ